MTRVLILAAAWLIACGSSDAPAPHAKAGHDHEAHGADHGAAHGEQAAKTEAADGWVNFGEVRDDGEVVTAASVLAAPADFVGRPLSVEGRVADVCQKAGCWMVVTDGDKTMRVRMKDHAFSVAKDSTGKTCRVQGEVVALDVDPDTIAHFKGESAKPEVMPENDLPEDAKVTYELVASAVRMQQ